MWLCFQLRQWWNTRHECSSRVNWPGTSALTNQAMRTFILSTALRTARLARPRIRSLLIRLLGEAMRTSLPARIGAGRCTQDAPRSSTLDRRHPDRPTVIRTTARSLSQMRHLKGCLSCKLQLRKLVAGCRVKSMKQRTSVEGKHGRRVLCALSKHS